MAKKLEIVEQEVEEITETPEVLPDNAIRLSSGVIILIDTVDLASSEVTKNLMVGVFKSLKVGKDGQIKEGSDPIKSADSIIQLQDTLLSNFASLYRSIEEELKLNPELDKRWLNKLKRSPMLTQHIDFEDEDDLQYLFMKYVGFASQDDWAKLIEKTIGSNN